MDDEQINQSYLDRISASRTPGNDTTPSYAPTAVPQQRPTVAPQASAPQEDEGINRSYLDSIHNQVQRKKNLSGIVSPGQTTGTGAMSPVDDPRHAAPTLFHESGEQTNEPDLTLQETLSQAASNLGPSAKENFKAVAHALTHPKETAGQLAQIGSGLASKTAGMFGVQQDPEKKQQEERAVDALWDHYKKVYFTSPQDFAKAFAKDPLSILMDFSTFTGAGAAVSGASKIGKIARIASTLTDPVQMAVKAAKPVAALPGKVLAGFQAGTSKVPYQTLRDIYQMGRGATPEEVAAAKLKGVDVDTAREAAFQMGRTSPENMIVETASNAVSKAADEASTAYSAGKAALKNTNPDLSGVLQEIQKAKNDYKVMGSVPKEHLQDYQRLVDLEQDMLAYSVNPNFNLLEADKLKRLLYNEKYKMGRGQLSNQFGTIARTLRDSIAAQDSQYANLMDKWQNWIALSRGFQEAGANSTISTSSAMTKLLKSMKTDLKRQNSIDVLAKHAPELPYMLAGYSTKSWHRPDIGLLELALSGVGYGIHPSAAVTGVALASPRLGSATQYALGKAAQYGSLASSKPVTTGALYGERSLQEQAQPRSQTSQIEPITEDVDAATRMILGEAASESDAGMAAAMHVALNRAKSSGESLSDVINRPNAFESVSSGRTKKINPNSDEYLYVRDNIVLPAIAGKLKDPTEGATYFFNPELQESLGRSRPEWASGDRRRIGRHEFYYGPYGNPREGRATGGSVKINHAAEAAKLIMAADRAKKLHNKVTERLLALPDEHVTQALAVANESI